MKQDLICLMCKKFSVWYWVVCQMMKCIATLESDYSKCKNKRRCRDELQKMEKEYMIFFCFLAWNSFIFEFRSSDWVFHSLAMQRAGVDHQTGSWESCGISDLLTQSLYFNTIPMKFISTLNFERLCSKWWGLPIEHCGFSMYIQSFLILQGIVL